MLPRRHRRRSLHRPYPAAPDRVPDIAPPQHAAPEYPAAPQYPAPPQYPSPPQYATPQYPGAPPYPAPPQYATPQYGTPQSGTYPTVSPTAAYPPYSAAPPSPPRRRFTALWIVSAAIVVVLIIGAAVFAAHDAGNGIGALSASRSPAPTASDSSGASASALPTSSGTDPSVSGTGSITSSTVAGGSITYTSTKGHFTAQFPNQPTETAIPGSIGANSYSLILAADEETRTIVESEDLSQPLTAAEQTAALGVAVQTTAAAGSLTVTNDMATTFQGHPAHQGDLTSPSGSSITVLVVAYSPTRIYELLAPSGAAFSTLSGSFVAVP